VIKVKVLAIDDRGKVRLSLKAVDQETGEDLTAKPDDAPAAENQAD
jgi:polyribonucleotide nucleotidyltransferase